MFQLVEIKGKVNEKGCIEIPVILLEQTGIRIGEELKLLYLAAGEKQDAEAVEAYVNAAVKTMSHEKQVALAARILSLAQQEGGKDC